MNGSSSYEVIGWFAKPVHIGFLMPMTIINLASLAATLIAMFMARKGKCKFDPTDPRILIFAAHEPMEHELEEWDDKVTYRPREVCGHHSTNC